MVFKNVQYFYVSENAPKCCSVAELEENQTASVIGVLYQEMILKPCVLDQFNAKSVSGTIEGVSLQLLLIISKQQMI